MIYDSGADYSFVSTTFMPLLDIKPSSLGFNFEIEIASGQLVEINKVIHGCKLEIEGHSFDIHLIPFGHRSFDVIIGMDWLSSYRAKIVCHERVVQIPLPHGEMLSVYRERPEEKVKRLMSAKVEEPKLEDIAIVRNFFELMRIEQYILMTDYSLWEVIKNGNKVLKRTIGETKQEYEPTTAEEKQDRRNEMKARGTLLMALPNKDQLKFHSYKDAKLLMKAIEK
ncbi:putative reverse transcriptase domain-containing protein, partial [Tanacetum coccineum]